MRQKHGQISGFVFFCSFFSQSTKHWNSRRMFQVRPTRQSSQCFFINVRYCAHRKTTGRFTMGSRLCTGDRNFYAWESTSSCAERAPWFATDHFPIVVAVTFCRLSHPRDFPGTCTLRPDWPGFSSAQLVSTTVDLGPIWLLQLLLHRMCVCIWVPNWVALG